MGTMMYDKRIITSSVLGEKSTENGGAEGDRTPDLYTASVALSQLSYNPLIILYISYLIRPNGFCVYDLPPRLKICVLSISLLENRS